MIKGRSQETSLGLSQNFRPHGLPQGDVRFSSWARQRLESWPNDFWGNHPLKSSPLMSLMAQQFR